VKIHFISDLHLCEEEPATLRAFTSYLAGPARNADTLYILGDLFEYWAGDDDDTPLIRQVADALSALAESGTALRFMAGNRDFLIGQGFASRCALRLLPDPSRLVVDGRQLLLTHGDVLCTDDTAYLQYRSQVRDPEWQRAFLARPLEERKTFIESLRARSRAENARKRPEIMDVNQDAVAQLLRTNDYPVLIHGHTHRPARHEHVVDDRKCERWVLSDWHGQAHYLEWTAGTATARTCPPPA
jgi:UDP-2,3-diacylglucosamine hydrolase